jgi:hypothetical protein
MASTKKTLKQYQVITAGAMTGTSVLTSSITAITGMDNIGFQFDFSGSPTGTFQVQVSANHNQDELGNQITAGTWIPLLLTYWDGTKFVESVTIPASAGTPVYVECTQLSAPYIRCVYTNASGSGVLNATICGKSL